MPESEPTPTPAPSPEPPGGFPPGATPPPATSSSFRRRLWRRLLVCTALSLLILGGAAYHLWTSRTAYLEAALQHWLPGWSPQLQSLELSRDSVEIRELTLRNPLDQTALVTIASARIDDWTGALTERQLGRAQLRGVTLRTSAASLPQLLSLLSPPPSDSASANTSPAPVANPSTAPWNLHELALHDLTVELTGSATEPRLRFRLDHQSSSLSIHPAGVPDLPDNTVTLRDFEATLPNGASVRIPHLLLEAAFTAHDRHLIVRRLSLPEPAALTVLPDLIESLQPFLRPTASASTTAAAPALTILTFESLELPSLHLTFPQGLPRQTGLPALAGELSLQYRGARCQWQAGKGFTQRGTHHFVLNQGLAQPAAANTPGHIAFANLTLSAIGSIKEPAWRIESLHLTQPDIHWTQALEDLLLPPQKLPTPAPPASSPRPDPGADSGPSLELGSVKLTSARLRLDRTQKLAFDFQSTLDLEGGRLLLDGVGHRVTSSHPQRLQLRHIRASIPGSRTAAPTTIEAADLVLRPDALSTHGLIDRLHITRPQLSYHLDVDALSQTRPPSSNAAPAKPPALASASLPEVLQRLHFAHLAVSDGTVALKGKWGAPFTAETSFNLTTEPEDRLGRPSSRHRLTIEATRLRAVGDNPLPLAQIGRLDLAARLPELLTQRRIEHIRLDSGQIEIGPALEAILDKGTAPPSAAPVPTTSPMTAPIVATPPAGPGWHAGEVSIGDLSITLQQIAPGLPPLTFHVQFNARETPLQAEALASHFEPQRIELSSLTIPSPYGSYRPVARLDTIFVHFTLDGLLRKRIDRVEIINPTLYVGEPLFWYVDYYRKFAAGESPSKSQVPKIALAANDPDQTLGVASLTVSQASKPPPSWSVEELRVHAGKLVLAPKGVPLPGFHQPFPFSFVTRLDSGEFEAVFDIPQDNYPLPDLKLELIGMKGNVRFNLPAKTVDNNLTETFTVDQIRWRQLHVEQAHLTVTYDLNGIYGKFGGEAYGGYIDGGFDVFLNDSYTWDAWVAATKVRATEITQKLTPTYFLLDGSVNGTVIAAGDAKELYQADIKFTNVAPGRFSIACLDDMLKKLPPQHSAALSDQVTRIGLETLRDFEYDHVDGSARFYGREGKGSLHISGPSGARRFEVNVFDHRWKVDPATPSSQLTASP